MRKRQGFAFAILPLFLFISSALTWAGINGSISGLVTDSTGAVGFRSQRHSDQHPNRGSV